MFPVKFEKARHNCEFAYNQLGSAREVGHNQPQLYHILFTVLVKPENCEKSVFSRSGFNLFVTIQTSKNRGNGASRLDVTPTPVGYRAREQFSVSTRAEIFKAPAIYFFFAKNNSFN